MSKIASIYSTDAICSCHVEKKYDICINADVLPKYPKIDIINCREPPLNNYKNQFIKIQSACIKIKYAKGSALL